MPKATRRCRGKHEACAVVGSRQRSKVNRRLLLLPMSSTRSQKERFETLALRPLLLDPPAGASGKIALMDSPPGANRWTNYDDERGAALSAGASDMSGWLLLGLPGALYLAGLSAAWIGIGLFAGAVVNWIVVAPRLRAQTESYGNALTIPQFLANRFPERGVALRVISAVVIVVFFVTSSDSGSLVIVFSSSVSVLLFFFDLASSFLFLSFFFFALFWFFLAPSSLLFAPIYAIMSSIVASSP